MQTKLSNLMIPWIFCTSLANYQ